ncbi:TIGR03086 family protein [Mycobacterium alsense]|uniref:TIGR03086 family protein n=1 Tax=Mycobacterium alsense TaxID=324058 RepID=A0AA41XSY1_9MYCO|nr:TIGR03086 family metal-binding protein [Mycobacterium alsense]MCV7381352.1 TIGR03086 family protein [Mycobacterium alsense]OQZ90627.1 TIGR03086 family protein [Mycobacterium alsense]
MPDPDERYVLGEATRYLFGSLVLVRRADLAAPTPCAGWDLRRLLRHVSTSLTDVTDVLRGVDPPSGPRSGADPVAAVRSGTVDFLLAASAPGRRCEVAGRSLPSGIVVSVGALEMVLHAWDIAQACRVDRPISPDVASSLLCISPPLAEAGLAGHVFAEPLPSPATATPSDQLLALFGRRPGRR